MFYVKIKKKDLGKDASVREDFAQTEDALRMSIRRHWIRRWVLQSIQEILSDANNDKISIWNNFYWNLLWMFIIIFYLTSCNIEYVLHYFFVRYISNARKHFQYFYGLGILITFDKQNFLFLLSFATIMAIIIFFYFLQILFYSKKLKLLTKLRVPTKFFHFS